MVRLFPISLILLLGLLAIAAACIVAIVVFATRRSGAASAADNPHLFPCPDCGQFISVRAATCPHCGGPIKGA